VHLRTPSSPAYTASKHGVLGFTKALAAELGKDGVRVNAIGPGFIETPLNEKVRAGNPELVKVFIDHTPLGRAGRPEDIVGPAIFLASDLAGYVTGSIVMADGGTGDLSATVSVRDILRAHAHRNQNRHVQRPHFDIDVASFWADPYPDLARMRRQAPIAFVPQLGSTVFTRRDDIFTQEKRTDVFSSHQPAGLMNT